MITMLLLRLVFMCAAGAAGVGASSANDFLVEIPCVEFHPQLDYPCSCGLNDINATRINCDGAVFAEFPLLPYR